MRGLFFVRQYFILFLCLKCVLSATSTEKTGTYVFAGGLTKSWVPSFVDFPAAPTDPNQRPPGDERCPQTDGTVPIYLPDDTDCTKYLVCSGLFGQEMKCPPGLHFNRKVGACDYPAHAKCPLEQGTSTTMGIRDYAKLQGPPGIDPTAYPNINVRGIPKFDNPIPGIGQLENTDFIGVQASKGPPASYAPSNYYSPSTTPTTGSFSESNNNKNDNNYDYSKYLNFGSKSKSTTKSSDQKQTEHKSTASKQNNGFDYSKYYSGGSGSQGGYDYSKYLNNNKKQTSAVISTTTTPPSKNNNKGFDYSKFLAGGSGNNQQSFDYSKYLNGQGKTTSLETSTIITNQPDENVQVTKSNSNDEKGYDYSKYYDGSGQNQKNFDYSKFYGGQKSSVGKTSTALRTTTGNPSKSNQNSFDYSKYLNGGGGGGKQQNYDYSKYYGDSMETTLKPLVPATITPTTTTAAVSTTTNNDDRTTLPTKNEHQIIFSTTSLTPTSKTQKNGYDYSKYYDEKGNQQNFDFSKYYDDKISKSNPTSKGTAIAASENNQMTATTALPDKKDYNQYFDKYLKNDYTKYYANNGKNEKTSDNSFERTNPQEGGVTQTRTRSISKPKLDEILVKEVLKFLTPSESPVTLTSVSANVSSTTQSTGEHLLKIVNSVWRRYYG